MRSPIASTRSPRTLASIWWSPRAIGTLRTTDHSRSRAVRGRCTAFRAATAPSSPRRSRPSASTRSWTRARNRTWRATRASRRRTCSTSSASATSTRSRWSDSRRTTASSTPRSTLSARASRWRSTRVPCAAWRFSPATRSARSRRCARPAPGSPELERLVEHDLALERSVDGAFRGDLHEALRLLLGQLLGEAHGHRELGRGALLRGLVVHVDLHLADLPALALGVHLDRHRGTRGEARGEQLLGTRAVVAPSVVLRLPRRRVVCADLEVGSEATSVAARYCLHRNGPYSSGLKTRPVGIFG